MSRHRNISLDLLILRSRWLVTLDSFCGTLAVLMGVTGLILCAVLSPVDVTDGRYRTCVIFEIDTRPSPYKALVQVHRCSDERESWPLPPNSASARRKTAAIHLSTKWSTLHFPGQTFQSRMAGWHYVPLANVSSVKCSRPCLTVRPKFLGYEFKPKSVLPFL